MKVIYNNLIPFKGFNAINLFGIVFARKEEGELTPVQVNHESIHTRQQIDCLALFFLPLYLIGILCSWWWFVLWPFGFYLLYFLEWGISYCYHRIKRLCRKEANCEAYKASAMEMEAYEQENDFNYLSRRYPLSWFKYYGHL